MAGKETIQDIALKVAGDKLKEAQSSGVVKERTIFVLGSKEVVSFHS